jgi:hypothetical protein
MVLLLQVIRLFLQVKEDYGLESAFSLLNSLRVAWGGEAEEENEPVEMSHVEDAFSEFMRTKGKEVSNKATTHLEELLSGDAYKKQAVESSGFVDKLGLSKMHPCLLMNGVVYGPNQVPDVAGLIILVIKWFTDIAMISSITCNCRRRM